MAAAAAAQEEQQEKQHEEEQQEKQQEEEQKQDSSQEEKMWARALHKERGRILVATRDIPAGARVLLDFPVFEHAADDPDKIIEEFYAKLTEEQQLDILAHFEGGYFRRFEMEDHSLARNDSDPPSLKTLDDLVLLQEEVDHNNKSGPSTSAQQSSSSAQEREHIMRKEHVRNIRLERNSEKELIWRISQLNSANLNMQCDVGYNCEDEEKSSEEVSITKRAALFKTAGLMNHSCRPNCDWLDFDSSQLLPPDETTSSEEEENEEAKKNLSVEGCRPNKEKTEVENKKEGKKPILIPSIEKKKNSIKVRILQACADIKKGEELTISYLSTDQQLQPCTVRRSILWQKKMFVCNCEACSIEQNGFFDNFDTIRKHVKPFFLSSLGSNANARGGEKGLQKNDSSTRANSGGKAVVVQKNDNKAMRPPPTEEEEEENTPEKKEQAGKEGPDKEKVLSTTPHITTTRTSSSPILTEEVLEKSLTNTQEPSSSPKQGEGPSAAEELQIISRTWPQSGASVLNQLNSELIAFKDTRSGLRALDQVGDQILEYPQDIHVEQVEFPLTKEQKNVYNLLHTLLKSPQKKGINQKVLNFLLYDFQEEEVDQQQILHHHVVRGQNNGSCCDTDDKVHFTEPHIVSLKTNAAELLIEQILSSQDLSTSLSDSDKADLTDLRIRLDILIRKNCDILRKVLGPHNLATKAAEKAGIEMAKSAVCPFD